MITRAISNEIQAEGHDAPILRPEEDLLNGIGVARAINQFIQTSPKGWSTRIGLYGPWGSGKTSILNLLKTIEEKQHSVVLSFSAWSAVEESDVISLFYEKLRECLIKEDIHLSLKHTYKHLARKVNPIRKLFNLLKSGLAALAELLPVPSLVAKLAIESTADIASFAVSWSKFDRKDLDDLVTQLAGRRVVVFIDDLDRADPKVVPKTLLALRELLDWPGFTFVLAFDKKIIARALSDYSPSFGDDAQGFLEKIIDIPFDLPPPKKQHKNLLISAALHACCKCISQATLETLTDVFPNQPRRIKLIARSIGALGPSLDRHSEEEIDWRSVYLHAIAWEENPKIIGWIISALSKEREDWSSWAINEDERNVHKEKIRKSLEPFLSNSLDSADIQRIFNVTHLLLTHWQNISDETIHYWAQLGSSPPSFTAREARDIQSRYLSDKNNEQVVVRIHQAALIADCSTEEAALDLAKFAIMEYETSLDSMADARTSIEWENRLKKATGNLTFLEYFLNECDDQFVRNSVTSGDVASSFLALVSRWRGWTRNEGEQDLREREHNLAIATAVSCVDPDRLYADTDPYWNQNTGFDQESIDVKKNWQEQLRKLLAPRIVERLLKKFQQKDGFIPIANGENALGAWLVESVNSPLYTDVRYSKDLVSLLQQGRTSEASFQATLAANALLYLRQILFQTRSAGWGGTEKVKVIHALNPELIPMVWSAVIECPVPFRMRSSLIKLRGQLIDAGVPEASLTSPLWQEIEK